MTDFAIMKCANGTPIAVKLTSIEAVSVNEDGGSNVQVNGYEFHLAANVFDIMRMLGECGYKTIVHKSFTDSDGTIKESEDEKA